MKNIFFRDGILIYYGNPAGYLSEGKVVLDSIFDKEEIIAFLSEKEKLAVEIRSGVYDRLSEGGGMEMTVEASKGRRIRIYQLTAVKILIAVVIGALLLAGLYALFGDVVMPTLTRRIQEMFNYAG